MSLVLVFVLALVASAWAQGDGVASQDVAAPTIAGTWEGQIATPPPLEVVVRFDLADGVASGTIDIPAQGAFLIPLEAIEVDGDAVRFVIAGVPGEPTFAGTLDAERLAGTFSQGGASFPFELGRVDEAVAADPEAAAVPGPGPADPEFAVPVDVVLEPPSDPGIERTVVVNYDSPTGLVHQAIAQLHEGVVHVPLVDADLEPVQRRGTQINLIFSG